MELLKHVSKYHTEETVEETEIKDKGENEAVEEEVKVDSILEKVVKVSDLTEGKGL